MRERFVSVRWLSPLAKMALVLTHNNLSFTSHVTPARYLKRPRRYRTKSRSTTASSSCSWRVAVGAAAELPSEGCSSTSPRAGSAVRRGFFGRFLRSSLLASFRPAALAGHPRHQQNPAIAPSRRACPPLIMRIIRVARESSSDQSVNGGAGGIGGGAGYACSMKSGCAQRMALNAVRPKTTMPTAPRQALNQNRSAAVGTGLSVHCS